GLSQLRSAKNPNLPRPTHPVLSTPWLAAKEPLLIGWNWGKVDQEAPAFMDVEGKYLIEGMRFLPKDIQSRLSSALGGGVADLESWKKEFFNTLPKAMVSWLKTSSEPNKAVLIISEADIHKFRTYALTAILKHES
ncbi:hypothetical protein, partial [Piscirickettsia salmonis]|uniref:hypothetical protein n=4 Tax=Piscirickettsia salmonis TaxID=1238 RepID=UPI00050A1812